ncbi:MAG: LemA family protein [Bacteroidia bacterium]|nr:LemA family protein [Bacteroidia bacterium]
MKGKGLLIVIGILVVLLMWGCGGYNGLVQKDVDVKKAWSDVQVQYQRRADLFGNLLSTVEAAATNEKDILTAVTNARAGITDAKQQIAGATTPAQLDAASQRIQSSAMSIRIAVEAYPTIRSTEGYMKLQDEITGTENRIATSRSDYNTTVASYNKSARTFPTNILAGMFGMGAKEEFAAAAGSDKAPELKFNQNK